jgi:HemK-like putative methylase
MEQKTLNQRELTKLWKIANGDKRKFQRYIERRLHHEPIAYIRGFATFSGRSFKVDRRVYVPNFETDKMVKLLLKDLTDNSTVLDVGTGCGSIAITVAKANPKVKVYASDINPGSLELARENARSHDADVEFFESNYVDCLDIVAPTHIIADLPYGITGLPLGNEEYLLSTNNSVELMHMPPNACFHPEGVLKNYQNLIRSIMRKGWKCTLFFETGKVEKKEVEKIIPEGITWSYERFGDYSVTVIDFSSDHSEYMNGCREKKIL